MGNNKTLLREIEEGGEVDRALTASPGLDETILRALRAANDGRAWIQPDV